MRVLSGAFLLLLLAVPASAMTINEVTSPSGLAAWLVEDHSLPVVTIHFAFPGGAASDPPGKAGLAALVAGLLDEGAGPYDTIAFQTRIEDLVADLQFRAGQDEFTGSLRTLKSNLGEASLLLRLALREPRFEASSVERVRGEIVASLNRQSQSPRSVANRLWLRDVFEIHPYGRNAEGSVETIRAIGVDDLRQFVAGRLTRAGLVIGIVGDLTPAEAATLVDDVFAGLPRESAAVAVPEAKPAIDGALVLSRRPVPQSVVTFGQQGPKRDDPDWYAARLVNEVLGGGGLRGRLMHEIREKRGLAYGVSTMLAAYRHAGLIIGTVATENSRVAESIALVRSEWRRMRDEGPTEEELAEAKAATVDAFPLTLDSTGQIASLLVEMQLENLGIDYLDRRAGLFESIDLAKARDIARRLLDPDRLSFAVVGNPVGLEPTRPTPELHF
jgi:zinc protease